MRQRLGELKREGEEWRRERDEVWRQIRISYHIVLHYTLLYYYILVNTHYNISCFNYIMLCCIISY